MATINNKLIHFKSKSDFNSRYRETTDGGNTYGDFLGTSIVFIQDAKQIWTHGQFYDANEATLASLGITATAEELNYMDGVTSNVQTQLNGKAATSHNHNASNINAGTLDIARIPTGTSASTVALGNHMHDQYLTDDDLSSYALKSEIPDISNLATKTELTGYLPLTGGTLTDTLNVDGNINIVGANDLNVDGIATITGGSLFLKETGAGIFYVQSEGIAVKSTNNGDDKLTLMGGGIILELTSPNNFTIDTAQILTENNWGTYITVTDTKNTTGTSQSTSKLYLAGGTSQNSTGVVTYSNSAVYTQSGQLYATQMNATNGFYETSDARLKNFKDDVKALDVVSEIPTKYFTWKEDENQELQIGTSAQEVQKIYPELVSKTEDDTLTVDYAKLSIIALAAIKELKAEIQSLKEEIKQLKSK